MKIGLCLGHDRLDYASIVKTKYIELNAATVESLSETDFLKLKAEIKKENLIITSANCLLPSGYDICKEGYNLDLLSSYMKRVAKRLSECNCPIVVLGSGSARNVDVDYGIEKGKRQFNEFLNSSLEILKEYDMKLVIEHLNKRATNYLNFLTETFEVAVDSDSDNCGILCDYYHLETEPIDNLTKVKDKLFHCHIASPKGRTLPMESDLVDYKLFFDKLREIDYKGVINIEAKWSDPKEVAKSIEYLRSL